MVGALKFNSSEKIILIMLSEIHEKLGIKGEFNPKIIREGATDDNAWIIQMEYGGLIDAEGILPKHVKETLDILDMYRILTMQLRKLSPTDKARVKTEVVPFEKYLKFNGFDANNHDHYGVTHDLINTLGRYDEHKKTALNNHNIASLDKYRNMYSVYQKLDAPYDEMSADDIIAVIKA